MGSKEGDELRIENLDHLGIVAGIIDRLGIVDHINERLGVHPDEVLSSGVVVKAMILNGLGFISAPMYLFSVFFEGKACEHLLGRDVQAEHLNDDKLGRVLDKLFEAGLTPLFMELALRAARLEGLAVKRLHLDSSSFSVHGAYAGSEHEQSEDEEPIAVRLVHGYSRDKRPDLKQFLVDLMTTEEGVPLFFKAQDGNSSDQKTFAKLIHEFRAQVNLEAFFVADAALYTQENLSELSSLNWVSRVPETIAEAREVLESVEEDALHATSREGYRVTEVKRRYGNVEQRWVVVDSQARRERAIQQVQKRLEAEREKLTKAARALAIRAFACEEDASKAVTPLVKDARYHQLGRVTLKEVVNYPRPGRPKRDALPEVSYRVEVAFTPDDEAAKRHTLRAGRFLLATNILDENALPTSAVLDAYLSQGVVERGFRFLKDPLFFTSSVFLKSEQRVAVLAMLMALCLLVYSLGERLLRNNLAEQEGAIFDQKGKATSRPTLRWVFQCFQAVHLVRVDGRCLIHGLSCTRRNILAYLSPEVRKYYLLT